MDSRTCVTDTDENKDAVGGNGRKGKENNCCFKIH